MVVGMPSPFWWLWSVMARLVSRGNQYHHHCAVKANVDASADGTRLLHQ
jgi:hypothetical protein